MGPLRFGKSTFVPGTSESSSCCSSSYWLWLSKSRRLPEESLSIQQPGSA